MELFSYFLKKPDLVLARFIEHFQIFAVSWALAVVASLVISIAITRPGVKKKAASAAISITGAFQSVPSIAVIAVVFLFTGIGMKPAIIALFLYSLVPIVFNAVSAFKSISPSLMEAAKGMGMSETQILFKVEIPQAVPAIFSGMRTAATINIGTATVASAVGAGGLGQLIFVGLRMIDTAQIFAGALPAALMALGTDLVLALLERIATSKGIRMQLQKL